MVGLDRDSALSGTTNVEIEKNQELTKLIGRRLREACGSDVQTDLPVAIARCLGALREAELHLADDLGVSLTSDRAALDRAAAGERLRDKINSG